VSTEPAPRPARDRFDERAARYTSARVGLYNEANARHPRAREAERGVVIDRLALRPGLTICDVGAGGGYLADGIRERLDGRCRIVCVENSVAYCESISPAHGRVSSSLLCLALADASVDRVAVLAGLHHQDDKAGFLREAHRVLKPGGRIVVADVREGSGPARFLTQAVDRWSDMGHDATFLDGDGFASLLGRAGFDDVVVEDESYTWDLPHEDALVDYCRSLFRMTRAAPADVRDELHRHLRVTEDHGGAHLHWSLTCAVGRKPQ
jgi:SAM-dependent methyltransferase